MGLFKKTKDNMNVVNVGLGLFGDDVEKQGASSTQVSWTPPRQYPQEVIDALNKLKTPEIAAKIEAANKEVLEKIVNSHPILIGYEKAIDVIPGMTKNTILHAGPPIAWDDMCGAMRGAVTGAIVFEGLASTVEEAAQVAASGGVVFAPCHEYDTVGSMAGVTSASMYVHIVKNKTYGNTSFTNLSEQLAKILRMGANDQSVIDRLNWMRDVLGPMLSEAMKIAKEIDLRLLLSQALHMGDEDHNRNFAGSLLLMQQLAPHIVKTSFTDDQKKEVFEFIQSSDYFSGPTWMAVSKCALDAAHNVQNSTVLTTMCRNGTEFGIRVSSMEGFQWITGPAQKVVGPMMAGYTSEDAGLDIGDSAIKIGRAHV